MHHSWRTSTATADYVPRTMVACVRDDPFSPKLAGPNPLSYAPRLESYNVTSSEMKYSRQKIASPFKRLHATPTHNTSPERVRAGGLIPGDFGSRPISSDSFFRPNTFDPPSTRQRRMDFSHELRVVKSPTNEALDAYKRPVGDLCSVPLRIVRHEPKCSTKSKRNPENSAKGVSRNVMGGFYAR